MKILKETPIEEVRLDVDMTAKEKETLLTFARKMMTVEQLEDLMIEWAFVEAVKGAIEMYGGKEDDKRSTKCRTRRQTKKSDR